MDSLTESNEPTVPRESSIIRPFMLMASPELAPGYGSSIGRLNWSYFNKGVILSISASSWVVRSVGMYLGAISLPQDNSSRGRTSIILRRGSDAIASSFGGYSWWGNSPWCVVLLVVGYIVLYLLYLRTGHHL